MAAAAKGENAARRAADHSGRHTVLHCDQCGGVIQKRTTFSRFCSKACEREDRAADEEYAARRARYRDRMEGTGVHISDGTVTNISIY